MEFAEFVESRLRDPELTDTVSVYAIKSFLRSAMEVGQGSGPDRQVRLWVASMMLDGVKTSTVRRYFGKIHALYLAWPGRKPDEANIFDPIKKEAEACGAVSDSEASANIRCVDRLVTNARGCSAPQDIDIFLYLLYDVEAGLQDVVSLKFGDRRPDCPQLDEIVDRRRAPRRKYVFDLGQGKRRDQQIVRKLVTRLHARLREAGMTFADGFSRDSITAIWIAAAKAAGIGYEEIRAMVDRVPDCYRPLTLIPRAGIS